MKLKELLAPLDVRELHADPELDITGISYDSRTTQPGELFVAVTGFAADGHKFIPKAVERGAAASSRPQHTERPPPAPARRGSRLRRAPRPWG